MKKIRGITLAVALVLLAIALLSGVYTLNTSEEAVVLRFGAYARTVRTAGLNWRLPFIEEIHRVNISQVHRIEYGFRADESASPGVLADELKMLTRDENFVDLESIIQYRVVDSEAYLFNVDEPSKTLRVVGESVIRRTVASNDLDDVMTDNKMAIQQTIKDDLQRVCNEYELGVQIMAVQLQDVNPPAEVEAAFKDVAGAREDKNSFINEAQTYYNEKIPNARGEAAAMINAAEGYKQQRVERAKGDVAGYLAVLEQYRGGQYVTRIRMYLETMERILPGIDKIVVSDEGNVVKWLPIGPQTPSAPAPTSAPSGALEP